MSKYPIIKSRITILRYTLDLDRQTFNNCLSSKVVLRYYVITIYDITILRYYNIYLLVYRRT